ncbi:hypothetical protein CcaverHIS002_0110980 [Cutaneotrichosporon cavernicola]|nr:hypothetical protein CcaverHIS002_0110980 [Cutaneotrichosporon cavernicola]
MTRRRSSDCEQSAPLLGADAEHGPDRRQRRRPRTLFLPGLSRYLPRLGRWPLLIAIAALWFFAGVVFSKGPQELLGTTETYLTNPNLDASVRVRVLNSLLKERYPQASGEHAARQSNWDSLDSFQFHFWAHTNVALGGRWVLAPEDYDLWRPEKPGHTYIGYSIEKRCDKFPMFTNREHRALILAKKVEYFTKEKNLFHGLLGPARDGVTPVFNDMAQPVNFKLISTAGEAGDPIDEEEGIETVGRKDQGEWTEILARSKALVGIGDPALSPSPYYALCMGVPFINPVKRWDEKDPDNRNKWYTQQDALRYTKEPYVYHVHANDQDGLRDALQRAADNPIPRYIPPQMRFEAIVDRVREFVDTDWQAAAREVVAEQYNNSPQYQYLAMDEPAEFLRLGPKYVS